MPPKPPFTGTPCVSGSDLRARVRGFLPVALLLVGWHALWIASPPVRAQSVSSVVVDDGTFGDTGRATSQAIVSGNPAVVYFEETHGLLRFARNSAADGSGTWSKTTIDPGLAGNYATSLAPSLAVVGGLPAVCYMANGMLHFARCATADGSGAWTVREVAAVGSGGDPSLAEVAGVPCVSCGLGGNMVFLRSALADGSGTWSFVTVDSTYDSGLESSLAVVNGKPAIAYHNRVFGWTGDEGVLHYARCSTADGTGAWTVATVDAAPGAGLYTSLAVVGGKPAISYQNAIDSDLLFARNSALDGSGTWTTTLIESTGFTGQHTSLAVVGGKPSIAFYSQSYGDLRHARCANADGSGTWTVTSADATSSVGLYCSLVEAGGKPSITYFDITNKDLKHARNSAADGSGTWTLTTADQADDTGYVGALPTLAVVAGKPSALYRDELTSKVRFAQATTATGTATWNVAAPLLAPSTIYEFSLAEAGGKPAATYYDFLAGDLIFARNAAADGSGTWTATTVDSAGYVGSGNSLATVGGLPAVSYLDLTSYSNPSVKLARNSAADASGAWTVAPATGLESFYMPALVDAGGKPGLFFIDKNTDDLVFARNSLADGSGTWSTAVVAAAAGSQIPKGLMVAGCPAVAYRIDEGGGQYRVTFSRNSAADGSGTWTTTAGPLLGGTPDLSLAVVAGQPAIAYQDPIFADARLARSSTADGSGAWTVTVVHPGPQVGGFSAPSLAAVGGQGGLALFDARNLRLLYSYLNLATPADIRVEEPTNIVRLNGTTIDCGDQPVGAAAPTLTFTVRNTGGTALTVTGLAKTGSHPGDFALSSASGFTLGAGATQTFTITFTPSAAGSRSCTLTVASSDPVIPSYQILLTGTGHALTPLEVWRLTYFGSPSNSGNGADGADPDHDGALNAAEFAFLSNPTIPNFSVGALALVGSNMEYTYSRSKAALLSGASFSPYWSETMGVWDWYSNDITEEMLSETTTTQTIRVTVPQGTAGHRFLQLSVSFP